MLEDEIKNIFDKGGHGYYRCILHEEYHYVDVLEQIQHEPGANHSEPVRIMIGLYLGTLTSKDFQLQKQDPVSGQYF